MSTIRDEYTKAQDTQSIDEKLRSILRAEALGNYTRDPDGNFVPLDWSGTPDSYYADAIGQIKAVFAEAGYIQVPTEAQSEFLTTVRDVFIPPAYQDQAEGYKEAHKLTGEPENNLYHAGIQQGMTQAIPKGDR